MRFPVLLAVGFALVAGGAALSEYARRHPSADSKKKKDDKKDDAKKKNEPAPLPTLEELTSHHNYVPEAPSSDDFTTAGKKVEELAAAAKPLPNIAAAAALGGTLNAKGLVRAGDGIALWVEESAPTKDKSRMFALTWLGATSKVLAPQRSNVGPIASDGRRIVWAEEGRILSVGLDAPSVKGVVEFGKARVVALAVEGDDVVAMLSPSELDPFSTDPASALVRFGADRNLKVLAKDLIRPQDVVVDASRAYFLAGYPAVLQSAALDGSDHQPLSDRAEPPLALQGDHLVFRRGGDAPGLYTIGTGGGGEPVRAAAGEIEKLGVEGDRFVFALGNQVLLHAGGKDEPQFELPSSVLELGAGGGQLWVLTRDDAGAMVLLKKPLK